MDHTGTLLGKSAYLSELALVLDSYTKDKRKESHFKTAIEGLSIVHAEPPMQPFRSILGPAICMTIQGANEAMTGEMREDYQPGQASIVSPETPYLCPVPAANSKQQSYFGLVIELNRTYARDVIEELGVRPNSLSKRESCGAFVLDLSSQLLNCVLRIVRLLETPDAIPTLYPGIMREICYWLLTGPACDRIVDTTMATGHDKRILRTVEHLRGNFSDQIRVEDLASAAGMSLATFHRQFKSVTSMSPLQYQKKLRLLAARRLMTTNDFNVETAAFEVGYVSPSQFSREYTRMFGNPPRRDISACRSSQSVVPLMV
jgi:AraC-like DNA-binding protein